MGERTAWDQILMPIVSMCVLQEGFALCVIFFVNQVKLDGHQEKTASLEQGWRIKTGSFLMLKQD